MTENNNEINYDIISYKAILSDAIQYYNKLILHHHRLIAILSTISARNQYDIITRNKKIFIHFYIDDIEAYIFEGQLLGSIDDLNNKWIWGWEFTSLKKTHGTDIAKQILDWANKTNALSPSTKYLLTTPNQSINSPEQSFLYLSLAFYLSKSKNVPISIDVGNNFKLFFILTPIKDNQLVNIDFT